MRGHINSRIIEKRGCEVQCNLDNKFTKYLYLGSRGSEVEKVQRFLKEQGFYRGKIDGVYG
jgi:hypothetical protein